MRKENGTMERIMLKLEGSIAIIEHLAFCEEIEEDVCDMLILPLDALYKAKKELLTLEQ